MKSVRQYFILITKLTFCLIVFQAGIAKSEEVNVYSHRHYEADDALYAKFTKETGIKVNIVKASADALIERIKAEGESSPADIPHVSNQYLRRYSIVHRRPVVDPPNGAASCAFQYPPQLDRAATSIQRNT